MSITTQEIEIRPAPPPATFEQQGEALPAGPRCAVITHHYDRFEPIYGSFKLHKRNGQWCTKHFNGGGLIALSARVQHTVYVEQGAAVLGHSVVQGNVRVEDEVIIDGNARVSGEARLREHARVSGNAVLDGDITMRRHAHVGENAQVRGMIYLDYYAFIGDESRLFGTLCIE